MVRKETWKLTLDKTARVQNRGDYEKKGAQFCQSSRGSARNMQIIDPSLQRQQSTAFQL